MKETHIFSLCIMSRFSSTDVVKHLRRIDARDRAARVSKLRNPTQHQPSSQRDSDDSCNSSQIDETTAEAKQIRRRAANSIKYSNAVAGREKFSRVDAMNMAVQAEMSAVRDVRAVKEQVNEKRIRNKWAQQQLLLRQTSSAPQLLPARSTSGTVLFGGPKKRRSRARRAGHNAHLDPKVLLSLQEKQVAAVEEEEAWTKLARRVLQNPSDLAAWEDPTCLPRRVQGSLPGLWEQLGKVREEKDAAYCAMSEKLHPMLKKLTNEAYELSMSFDTATGRLPAHDRVALDSKLAAATCKVHTDYLAREKTEAEQMQREIRRLYQEIARTKRDERQQLQVATEEVSIAASSFSGTIPNPPATYRAASQQQAMALLSQPTVASGGKLTEERQQWQREQLAQVVHEQSAAAAEALKQQLLARRREVGGRVELLQTIPKRVDAKLREREAAARADVDWLRSKEAQILAVGSMHSPEDGRESLRERALVRQARALTSGIAKSSTQELTQEENQRLKKKYTTRKASPALPKSKAYSHSATFIDKKAPLMETIVQLTDELSERKTHLNSTNCPVKKIG